MSDELKQLAQKIEKAGAEWMAASEQYETEAARPEGITPKAGMRLSRAQNAWYVLCSTENILPLCRAVSEQSDNPRKDRP